MRGPTERVLQAPASGVSLPTRLVVPEGARGVVVVPYPDIAAADNDLGRRVVDAFAPLRLATMFVEPWTSEERSAVLDAHIAADRLVAAIYWIVREEPLHELPIGLFGIEPTSEAVLAAAAALSDVVRAVVAAGGQPRLGSEALGRIEAPTLLIAPSRDAAGLACHRATLGELHVDKKLEVLGGIETVAAGVGASRAARLAARLFDRHLDIPKIPGHTSHVRPRV
jgi:putative phosphoribosyl transferase